jgi:hypothetical protein
MTEEFKVLKELYKEKKIFISYKRSMDPFQVWLLWFSGWLSKLKEGKLIWKFFYIFYWVITSFWTWTIFAIGTTLIYNNKFYLLCIFIPFIITHLFRQVGYGFLTYDILQDEQMLDTLWTMGLVAGILSTDKINWEVEKDEITKEIAKKYWSNHSRVYIWSYNNKDWRQELLKNFATEIAKK